MKRSWKTTLIGIGEAFFLELSAEALFELTNKQRALVIGLAVCRAAFGYFAKDKDVSGAS